MGWLLPPTLLQLLPPLLVLLLPPPLQLQLLLLHIIMLGCTVCFDFRMILMDSAQSLSAVLLHCHQQTSDGFSCLVPCLSSTLADQQQKAHEMQIPCCLLWRAADS